MPLTEEIKGAARQLGQALRQDDYIRLYLDALRVTQNDPETSALEKKMYEDYEELIRRQQSGEALSREEIRPFDELRRQLAHHPLIVERNDMLNTIRPYLHQVAEEISFVLGVDYAELTKPQ